MTTNESSLDRILRGIAGIVVLFLSYAFASGWIQYVGYVLGVVLLITAFTGFCCMYKLLGITTHKTR